MRNRYRRMYQMTGLPGWIRQGFSPFWRGRAFSGIGSHSRYTMLSNQPPFPYTNNPLLQNQTSFSFNQNTALPGFSSLYDPWGMAVLTPEEELNFMKMEAEQLEDQLYTIEKRIKVLEEKE